MMINIKHYLFILSSFTTVFDFTQDHSANEYNLKAAFIYNFTKYVDWNSSSGENEFIIGVVGHSAIYVPLEIIANTKSVNGKRIQLRQFSSLNNYTFCNAIFISKNTDQSIEEILEKVERKGTLIISEKNGYALKGSAINFILINNSVKFEINTNKLKVAGLNVSSQLLKLAIIVN